MFAISYFVLYASLLVYLLLIDGNLHGPGVLSILTLLKRSIIPRLPISEMLLKIPYFGWFGACVARFLFGLLFDGLVWLGYPVGLLFLLGYLVGGYGWFVGFILLVWLFNVLGVFIVFVFDIDFPFSFAFVVVCVHLGVAS